MNENIRNKFEALVSAITFDIKQRIVTALNGAEIAAADKAVSQDKPAPAKPVVRRKVASKVRSAQKTDVKAVAERFLAHVRKHPGLRAEQVMEAIGQTENSRRLMPQIREELGTQVKTKGQRRGMTYFVKGA